MYMLFRDFFLCIFNLLQAQSLGRQVVLDLLFFILRTCFLHIGCCDIVRYNLYARVLCCLCYLILFTETIQHRKFFFENVWHILINDRPECISLAKMFPFLQKTNPHFRNMS